MRLNKLDFDCVVLLTDFALILKFPQAYGCGSECLLKLKNDGY